MGPAFKFLICLCAGLTGTASLAQSSPAPGASGIYACVDGYGRRLTSDRPIPQCLDREQRLLGPTGVERRRLAPTPTESELAEQARERVRQQEAAQRQEEALRRDRLLLARYPQRALHDAERKRAAEQLGQLQISAQQRLLDLEKNQFGLRQEMEFYEKNPTRAPFKLRQSIETADAEVLAQKQFMVTQAEELRRLHQRFDAELSKLEPLWLAAASAAAAPAPAASAPAAPAAAAPAAAAPVGPAAPSRGRLP